ncbi:uncharacterized protein LOC128552719, partial [Mercenaria mercenaria]|uniref:uncharacterized protein LOC128552719 n=1 Tax=Mercenaria mercenaria TaxID=6596 RepID=UPI00234E4F99
LTRYTVYKNCFYCVISGHGWAALLIAGNDRRDTVAKSFKEDVKEVHKVIISKCPLVMGVRADHVQTVHPEIPGQQDNILDKIKKSVTNLTNISGIHTLLVYLSGHYKPLKGGFELSHYNSVEGELQKETTFQYLSLKGLQDIIVTILNGSASVREGHTASKRAIVFLDCCSAPAVTTPSVENVLPSDSEQQSSANLSQAASGDANSQEKCSWIEELSAFKLDPDISIVAINACRSDQYSFQEKGGSVFRRFLIQGLTRVALGGVCEIDQCDHCHISGDFVTVGNLHTYISDHLTKFRKMYPSDPVMNVYNASGLDAKIGYVINFKADLQFTYRLKEKVIADTIPQRMFSELSELQSLLFDRYVEKMELDVGETLKLSNADFNGILCVEVEKGPKSHQRDRLESLDRIMTAWNAKRELVVSLRTLPEIYRGMVGIFMPFGETVMPVLDFLLKSTCVGTEEKDHATIFKTKLGEDFDKLSDDANDEQTSTAMEKFSEHLINLDDALQKCPEMTKHYNCVVCNKRTKPKERRIINKDVKKYLRKALFIDLSSEKDIICNKCKHKYYTYDICTKSKQNNSKRDSQSTRDADFHPTTSNSSVPAASPPSVKLNIPSTPKTHARCLACKKPGPKLIVISAPARFAAFLHHNVIIPAGARCCPSHIEEKTCMLRPECLRNIPVTEQSFMNRTTILNLLKQMREMCCKKQNTLDFDNIKDEEMRNLTGLSLEQFNDLFSHIKDKVKATPARTSRTSVGLLLLKLRSGMSNKLLSNTFQGK